MFYSAEQAIQPHAGTGLPFCRADHVGSLHRPQSLRDARLKLLGLAKEGGFGRHANEELRRLEDEYIRRVVQLQEDIGFISITDGEYRRQIYLSEFISSLSGINLTLRGATALKRTLFSDERVGKSQTEDVENERVQSTVDGKIRWVGSVNVEPFEFLHSVASSRSIPKVTLPSPSTFYSSGGRASISKEAYEDLDEFWADLSASYRREVKALADAGCTHIQFDEVAVAFLCDDELVANMRQRGDDPDDLLRRYVQCVNDAISGRPAGVKVSMHICRGNRHGYYMARGGYDRVAEYVFNEAQIDNFYLEYDSPRAGSFEPLRAMPPEKTVVLGLITTKRPQLEDEDHLRRRIDEASKYIPLERLAISPQCGFAGNMMSDAMSYDEMIAKLRLVVSVARKAWGTT